MTSHADPLSRPADAYHTLYCLAGLSAAQHRVAPSLERRQALAAAWKDQPDGGEHQSLRKEAFLHALSWVEEEGGDKLIGGAQNRLVGLQPFFNLFVILSLYDRTQPIRCST